MADRGASDLMLEKTRIDLVDFGPPDLDHMHVTNARSSISLVKSDGRDLIAHSANVERQVATRRHSDEDQTAKIKEWSSCRGIVAHLLRATWHHRGRPKLLL